MNCFNINLPEVQILKNRSGLSDLELAARCAYFQKTYNRLPHLDELPNHGSYNSMREELGIKSDGSISTDNLLTQVSAESVEQAMPLLNDKYRDQEIHVMELGQHTLIQSKTRPNKYNAKLSETEINIPENINSVALFTPVFDKLKTIYGIDVNITNMNRLHTSKMILEHPSIASAKGFILDGQIYVNTDLATADTPIHELLHLYIGSMRFQNPSVYQELLQNVMLIPEAQQLLSNFSDRSQNDACEEILVTELSKSLAGMSSELSKLDQRLQYEIFYNIARTIDSVLMGDHSAHGLNPNQIAKYSIKDLAQTLSSSALNIITESSLDDAKIHRILQNNKSDLMKEGQLKEYCV